MQKLLLLTSFVFVAPLVLLISIVQFAYISSLKSDNHLFLLGFMNRHQIVGVAYAALPSTTEQVSGAVETNDARIAKLQQFFHAYGSVLEDYSKNFIDAADKYDLDYKLLPAIAMQESGGCKKIIKDSHNCYGYGIYTNHTTTFSSYEEGIDTVAKAMQKYYISQGINTPEEIGKKWNPADTNGWKEKIKHFMSQI
jgi:hypothetical protein